MPGPGPSIGSGPLSFVTGLQALELSVGLVQKVRCLMSLEDEMGEKTRQFLREASQQGHFLTSPAGVHYLPEDRADAFGHSYIACQGTRRCGVDITEQLGNGREAFRELMAYATLGIWGHNSFTEDVQNQAIGRRLGALAGQDCYSLCFRAAINGLLKFHGQDTAGQYDLIRVYVSEAITLDGHTYEAGWRVMPRRYFSNLRY
jgi:hypothetical protein